MINGKGRRVSEPTEYPVDLPVTPKMAERMRVAGWAPVGDDAVTLIVDVLNNEGCASGGMLHGWRCSYPDRYGPCDCVKETAREIVAALRGDR